MRPTTLRYSHKYKMGTSKPQLVLENVGPIRRADVCFSDLTVLVGPQATGKSLFLQFLKLVLDHGPILTTLRSHGLDWNTDLASFLDLYLGRGMSSVWMSRGNSKSRLQWREQPVHLDAITAEKQPGTDREQCFVPSAFWLSRLKAGYARSVTSERETRT